MKSNSIKLGAYDAEVYEELSVPEVFADLFNGAVFGGQEIIRRGSGRFLNCWASWEILKNWRAC